MTLKLITVIAGVLFASDCDAELQKSGEEVTGFTRTVLNLRFVGKRRPLSLGEIEAQAKWIAEHPVKNGRYILDDTEYFIEYLEPGKAARKVWARKVRIKEPRLAPSIVYPFGRKGLELLDVHYDSELALGVIVYWYSGLIRAEVISGPFGGVVPDTKVPGLVGEYDTKLMATSVVFDRSTRGVRLALEFGGEKKLLFRFESSAWIQEIPPANPEKD